MAVPRRLEEGDLVKQDDFNSNDIDYNSIELYENNDDVSKNDLNRPIKNIYSELENNDYITDKISLTIGLKDGIYLNDFELDPNTDVKTVLVKDSSNNIVRKHFLRVSPGAAFLSGKNIAYNPTISLAERQIYKILRLESDDSVDEKVNINYYRFTDKFDIQIRKKNNLGILQNYNFSEGDYGDSLSGFDTGIEALLSIYGDSTNFSEFKNTIYENIDQINLEENILLNGGDSIFVGFNENYKLVGDTFNVFFLSTMLQLN